MFHVIKLENNFFNRNDKYIQYKKVSFVIGSSHCKRGACMPQYPPCIAVVKLKFHRPIPTAEENL
jgi:hypothetical protein